MTTHSNYRPGMTAERYGLTGDAADEFNSGREEARIAAEFAQFVYDRRTALGISQTELARRARTTQTVVSRIENSGGTPTLGVMVRLTAALGKSVDVSFKRDFEIVDTSPRRKPVRKPSLVDAKKKPTKAESKQNAKADKKKEIVTLRRGA